ncbi:MAG TPA: alpha/beta hydrolase [Stellaceae bacterium]|nr:alpha/beta hydrolase [Stellaceae bacterium]
MVGHTETKVTLHGCSIHVIRGGNGAPLVYLHGAGGGGLWLPWMEDLAQKFNVIVPEHPGFGRSDMPEWLDGIHDVALFYLEFLAAENLTDVHLMGGSLGGWIAAEMAMLDASRLKTLTLIGPAGIHVSGVRKPDPFMWSAEELARRLFHDRAMADEAAKRAVDPAGDDVRMKNIYTVARLAWHPRFYDPLLMKWLKRVTLPTLIVWGRDDQVLPVALAQGFAERLPQAEIEIVPDCGHLPQLEKKEFFVERVTRFIAGSGR